MYMHIAKYCPIEQHNISVAASHITSTESNFIPVNIGFCENIYRIACCS